MIPVQFASSLIPAASFFLFNIFCKSTFFASYIGSFSGNAHRTLTLLLNSAPHESGVFIYHLANVIFTQSLRKLISSVYLFLQLEMLPGTMPCICFKAEFPNVSGRVGDGSVQVAGEPVCNFICACSMHVRLVTQMEHVHAARANEDACMRVCSPVVSMAHSPLVGHGPQIGEPLL